MFYLQCQCLQKCICRSAFYPGYSAALNANQSELTHSFKFTIWFQPSPTNPSWRHVEIYLIARRLWSRSRFEVTAVSQLQGFQLQATYCRFRLVKSFSSLLVWQLWLRLEIWASQLHDTEKFHWEYSLCSVLSTTQQLSNCRKELNSQSVYYILLDASSPSHLQLWSSSVRLCLLRPDSLVQRCDIIWIWSWFPTLTVQQ